MPPDVWKELDGNGKIFHPWETAVLLDAQERVSNFVDLEKIGTKTAASSVANVILRVARQFEVENVRLDAQAIADVAVHELLSDR
ncbi:hypothetical protein [Beijerinckia sp. L45]|uniref:hypothetical protein n=1 Tax=Beijerinckia sp. L45 TaxID=1641855 RepID=UPI00131E6DB5|nr:hypothetical protein [Beijerinckia sp. L45]